MQQLRMKSRTVVVLCCAFILGPSGQLGPSQIVREFCEADMRGMRLSSDWTRYDDFTTWENQPGWDTALVVSEYRIAEPDLHDNQATILVEYDVVGAWAGDEWIPKGELKDWPPDVIAESVEYRLRLDSQGWRIVSPMMNPRISVDSAITLTLRLLNEQRARYDGEEDSSRLDVLDKTLKALQQLAKESTKGSN